MTYSMYRSLTRLPWGVGRRVFSYAFARRARYVSTIRPRFLELRPHHASLRLPDRKAVHNHIGTVHAIAVCNGLEAALGANDAKAAQPVLDWMQRNAVQSVALQALARQIPGAR